MRALDAAHMCRALDLARKGWGETAPNPMVGAVVVKGDNVVGEGFHARFGGDHAEVVALNAAGNSARDSTLYVTLEPCTHYGQTPPCADSIIASGVKRVVIAMPDPNPEAGGGIDKMRNAGLQVVVGIESDSATELNAPFVNRYSSSRPWITLKLAISVDGAIADSTGASKWISGQESRDEVQRLRAGSDAIAVGMRTVMQDDPGLSVRARPVSGRQPARVVFGRSIGIPDSSRIAGTAHVVPTYFVTYGGKSSGSGAMQKEGIELIQAPSLEEALVQLRERGIESILVEGGAQLAAEFIEARLVDRMVIFQAPLLVGSGALNAFGWLNQRTLPGSARLRVLERKAFGEDQMTTYSFIPR